ncbi:unnamed protein product [Urochloa humidicola]
MPIKPCWDSRAVQVLTCFTLMLALAHPVWASSRGATSPAHAPNAPAPAASPTVHSPALAPTTTPSVPVTPAVAPAQPGHQLPPEIWDVEYILWAPDCKQHGMIGINGMFPGPTITANAGDIITVVVNNKLHTEGVVIHWHGIRQIGTPWADGTASISQCPINTGETFTYQFTADKPGTFFYHGHFGMQRAAGLYGLLIVNVPEKEKESTEGFKYDGELHMLLSDWYHEPVYAQAAGLERKYKEMQWIGEPQTLLINGSGQFGCTLGDFKKGIHRDAKKCDRKDGQAVEAACIRDCDRGGEAEKERLVCEDEKAANCSLIQRRECGPFCKKTQCGPVVFDVEPGKTYRLRIASTTSLSALNVQVQGHKLKVVEADGNFVERIDDLDSIDIYSGESYSVLLETTAEKQGPSPYWISVSVIGRHPKTLPALAVLRYAGGGSSPDELVLPKLEPPETPVWNDLTRSKWLTENLKARAGSEQPPPKSDRTIVMLNTQELVDGQIKWAINNFSLSLPATPYLGAYAFGIHGQVFDADKKPPENYASGYDIDKPPQEQEYEGANSAVTVISDRVYTFEHGEVVDVVLQNADMRRHGISESHPWHLHGHDFWVLGYGNGKYEHGKDSKGLDEAIHRRPPPLRNTVVVFPHGWTKIRFKADNPGVWAFHCHIEPHLHMGMGVVFAEAVDLVAGKVPRETMMCGKTAATAMARALGPATPPSP